MSPASYTAMGGILAGLLWASASPCNGGEGAAQPAWPPAPDASPAAAPQGPRAVTPAVPSRAYGAPQAAQDSYVYAEQQRREAIARQLYLQEYLNAYRGYHSLYPYSGYLSYRLAAPPATGYLPETSRAYRLERRIRRDMAAPVAGAGYGLDGARYMPPAPQPLGHVTTWTGPNSYNYRPIYGGRPTGAEASPGVAAAGPQAVPPPPQAPSVPARGAAEPPAAPVAVGDASQPEVVPAPVAESSGPREF